MIRLSCCDRSTVDSCSGHASKGFLGRSHARLSGARREKVGHNFCHPRALHYNSDEPNVWHEGKKYTSNNDGHLRRRRDFVKRYKVEKLHDCKPGH